jgi:hypothetical protein
MTFTKAQVLKAWDTGGLEVVKDLANRWGLERVPDPLQGETLENFVSRCARMGLCHLAGDQRDQRSVRERMQAESEDLPIYQLTNDAEEIADLEAERFEEAATKLRETNPADRFAAYKSGRDELLNEPTYEFEENGKWTDR